MIIPAIWLFTALILTLFGVVMYIGLVFFILYIVAYFAVFIIGRAVRAIGGTRYD